MQPYPRSPDLVWPGHLHGTGCLSARAVGTGFPTVVRRWCLGPVCGCVWVLSTPPVLAGVLGACLWARFLELFLFRKLLVVFVIGLRFRPAYGTCVVLCALCWPPPFPVPLCVLGACVLCVLGPGLGFAPPFLAGLSGCVFCAFLFLFGFVLSVAGCLCTGPCGPCPPIPFLSGWAAGSFFFVCLHVSVFLFQLGRCSWLRVAGFGWVFPLCLFRGPVFGAFWVGGLAASGGVGGRFGGCGLFSRPPPSPLCFCFGGGGCLFLPLPFLGWRKHWAAFSVVFHGLPLAVAFCLAVFGPHGSGGLCTRWARRPFLPG